MKWSIAIIIIILLIPSTVIADRPNYSFSDDVFNELEPFPNDFWEIKSLLSSQSIMASQLNESYYQPELLPMWSYWAKRVYSNGSNTFGSYGIFIYPSLFNINNVQEGDVIDVSALIYTNWGIQMYQGAEIYFTYPDHIEVELLEPCNSNILLSPTYPQFIQGWMQLIEIRIHINEEKNATINIAERTPIGEYDSEWKDTYQPNYTSGSSLISQRISKCQIKLTVPEKEVVEGNIYDYSMYVILFIVIAAVILSLGITYDRHKKKDKKRT